MTGKIDLRIAIPEGHQVDGEKFDEALSKLVEAHSQGTYFVWGLVRDVVKWENRTWTRIKNCIIDAFLTHSYNLHHPGAGYIMVGEVTIDPQ